MPLIAKDKISRVPFGDHVVVGKYILELLSSAMYVDPLTIYREFVQNAADALDDAQDAGLFSGNIQPRIDITIDLESRSTKIRDNGSGIPRNWTSRRLTSLGASKKRGTSARGFRGVGRLAGLAYCQEMIFRTRASGEDTVYEMRWDCRRLKELLTGSAPDSDLDAILHQIVTVGPLPPEDYPPHFFEVELRQALRHKNDVLLNEDAISSYLAQVGPVPFSSAFSPRNQIQQFLDRFGAGKTHEIFLNGGRRKIVRPFQNGFEVKQGTANTEARLETFEVAGINDGTDAVGWILHHDYLGAIPDRLGIKGFRARVGNIQIGDAGTLQNIFPETRFNSWAIGEVHILSARIVPNARRDDFESNTHHANLMTHLTPLAKGIAKACRESSAQRARRRMQKAEALNVNGHRVDWIKAKDFFSKNARKPLSKSHKSNLAKVLQNAALTYSGLVRLIVGRPK
jgi:hypothetical protein